jgi:hypothetical protein
LSHARPNYGFVLRGGEPYASDNASCVSQIDNFQLRITYWTS